VNRVSTGARKEPFNMAILQKRKAGTFTLKLRLTNWSNKKDRKLALGAKKRKVEFSQ
jgi:hypothetical protein